MSVYPLVFGVKLRLTKVNSCGLPLAGPANRIVTSGFVTANFTPQLKDAADLDQNNAEGLICVTERTQPQRKRWQLALELCSVNTGVIALLTSWEQLLDYADNPNGFQDSESVESDLGVAIEIWTGGKSDTDCPEQLTDSIFSTAGTGKQYGYMLAFGTEFMLGNVNVGAQVSTLTLTGITFTGPQWGKGPYNVAGTDVNGTPGRLLTPTNNDSQLLMFRTPVAPPADTPGAEPAALAISTLFTGTTYYFGGPANAPAAEVAPAQGSAESHTLTLTGGPPTAGTIGVKVNGLEAPITFNSTAAAAKTLLVALDDGYTASDFTVTGGPLPGTPLVIATDFDADIEIGTNSLTPTTTAVIS
jgi:hypothetical protein